MAEAIRIHTEATGERPLGWYTGRTSVNSPQAGARRRRLPLFVGHLCGRPALLGQRTERTASAHSLHARCQRHALRQPAGLRQWRGRSSPICATPSTCSMRKASSAPKMMSVGLHCRLVGRPGRAAGLARFLDHIARHDGSGSRPGSTSRATGTASTSAWRRTRPVVADEAGMTTLRSTSSIPRKRPSFVAALGDIFEHAPWVAERAARLRPFAIAGALHGRHGGGGRGPPAPSSSSR